MYVVYEKPTPAAAPLAPATAPGGAMAGTCCQVQATSGYGSSGTWISYWYRFSLFFFFARVVQKNSNNKNKFLDRDPWRTRQCNFPFNLVAHSGCFPQSSKKEKLSTESPPPPLLRWVDKTARKKFAEILQNSR